MAAIPETAHTFKTIVEAKAFDARVHERVSNNLHLLPLVIAEIDRELADDAQDCALYQRVGHRIEDRYYVDMPAT